MGHEIIGKVVKVDPDIELIKVGNPCSVPFNVSCGRCQNWNLRRFLPRRRTHQRCQLYDPSMELKQAVRLMHASTGLDANGRLSSGSHASVAERLSHIALS